MEKPLVAPGASSDGLGHGSEKVSIHSPEVGGGGRCQGLILSPFLCKLHINSGFIPHIWDF